MEETRLVDLETKLAYVEYHVEQLNDVVTGQQKEIDQLNMKVESLIKHIQSSLGSQIDPADEPPPPHY